MVSSEVRIRQAALDDVLEIARLNVAAWQVAYRGCMPDGFLDSLDPERRARGWSDFLRDWQGVLLVALRRESVIGFVALGPSRDPDAPKFTAEVTALYVTPQVWRAGVGTALLDAAVHAARQRRYQALTLWVLEANARARSFYEARGLVHDGREKTDQRFGFPLHELRYAYCLDTTSVSGSAPREE